MNRILSPRSLAALAVFASAFAPAPAHALGAAFTCSAVTYQVVGAQLKIGSVDNNVLSYTNVGAAHTGSYNAGGYNTVDNFIYALSGSPASLLKVASDGTLESNAVTGVTTPHAFVAGDVSTDGQSLIAYNMNDDKVWSIDLDTFVGTEIGSLATAMPPADVGDFAIVTDGGESTAYGFDTDSGMLVYFDPTESTITVNVNPQVEIGAGGAKGAVWADSSGNLTVFVNATGDVYSVKNPSAVSPVVKKVASGATAAGNDGMKCALAASAFTDPDESVEELATTGVSPVALSLIAGTSLALFTIGKSVRRTRRRDYPHA